MGKAIAIALTQDNAFTLTVKSVANFLKLIAEFMYGTPERTKYTYMFVIGLVVLSCALRLTDAGAFSTCSQDTLAGAV